jgi:hypothetical protein
MAESPRIEELKRRVRLDPASIAFAALAEEYRKAGDYDAAVSTCLAGLQRHPSYLSARVTLGRALIALGRYDEAREHLEQVLRIAPENLAAIRGLADLHHRGSELPETVSPEHAAAPHAGSAAPGQAAAPLPEDSVRPPAGEAAATTSAQEGPAADEVPRAEEPPDTAPPEQPAPPAHAAIRPVRLSTLDSVEIETSGPVQAAVVEGDSAPQAPAVEPHAPVPAAVVEADVAPEAPVVEPPAVPAAVVEGDAAPQAPVVEPHAPAESRPIRIQFEPPMVRRTMHPDESALPALEALHAALLRACFPAADTRAQFR